jgi:hypothetical protein
LGECLLWVVFLKITEVAQILGASFSTLHTIMTKKMDWATFWAIFVTTSSGHPDLEALALVFI